MYSLIFDKCLHLSNLHTYQDEDVSSYPFTFSSYLLYSSDFIILDKICLFQNIICVQSYRGYYLRLASQHESESIQPGFGVCISILFLFVWKDYSMI